MTTAARADAPPEITAYLQADATVRAGQYDAFLAALNQLVQAGESDQARAFAARAVSPLLDYSSIRRLRKFLAPTPGASALRIAVLGGPTTTQLVELLHVCLAGAGIDASLYQCEYGLFRHELLAPDSGLDAFRPQIVILATSGRDLMRQPTITMTAAEVGELVAAETADWMRLWQTAQSRWGASVIQNTGDVSPWNALGHHAVRHAASPDSFIQAVNASWAREAPAFVQLHDLNRLVAELGAREWFDPRFYLEAKMPCGPECLVTYAHSLTSQIVALAGRSRKVLVLDLDNTLWGGVVGDVGAGGVEVGQGSGEGEAYLAFQQYARSLRDRGVVLAVCSKNDDARAREPFEQRDEMALKLDDFACFVANWRDKAENLRAIASQLDLGLDALVFFDDNPAERALVRRLLPMVAVPDVPADPSGYVQALARYRFFETVSFTREDAGRAQSYALNAQRHALASQAGDLDAFLASLQMTARVEPVNPINIERVAQLIGKSNQFNLTTRRRTIAELQQLAADPAWVTLTISLKDMLGDHGLISVVLAHQQGATLDIDTWLMSCRVLQRGVEAFVRDALVAEARRRGCDTITGSYVPTDRNDMVRDLLPRLGWAAAGATGDTTWWRLDLSAAPAAPTHIRREAC